MSTSVRGIEQIRDWMKVLESERSVNRNFIKSLRNDKAQIEKAYMDGTISSLEWVTAIRKIDEEVESTRDRIIELDTQITAAEVDIANLQYEDDEAWAEEDRSDVSGWGGFS